MKSAVMFSLLIAVSGSALAADTGWQRCRAMTDSSERLACYDALVDQSAAVTQAAPVATNIAPPLAVTATAAATDTTAAMSATNPVRRQQTTAEFGFEHQIETKLEAIVSRIPGEFRGWEAKDRITLENGQIWQIADGSRGVYVLNNPAVTIERGALGTFMMRIDGANRAPKVKRLK